MYNKGDRVIHTSENNWGVGQILDIKGGGNISIFFSEKGLINFHIKYAKLLKLASKKVANNYILNNLYIPKNDKKMHYRNISDSISLFLNKYPLGFYDEKYLKDERNYKYKTHIYAVEELSKNNLSKLLKEKDYASVCSRAKKVMHYKEKNEHKMNLIYTYGESMSLEPNLNIEDNQELFAKNLYDLLYGGDALMNRFNRFCDTLIRLEADKWAVATFFLFIIFPNQYMLIRPTPTIEASEMCGIDIKYNTKTNYETFDCVNQFSNFLKVKLSQLKPRDMIDIQSFMWCIRLFKI